MGSSNGHGGVPPGFRFHPTDEELLHYYLKKKVSFQKFDMEVIREVDLNKIEPWELQERCKIGSTPQNEWYFFGRKDRKYPTGSRTNRATNAGFWKATGRDKCIRNSQKKIGMRKTLVFYRGRAPHGEKTDWIMHEYRLEDPDDQENPNTASEDGWVVCKVFKKKNLFKVAGNREASAASSDDHLLLNSDNHRVLYHHQQLLHIHEDHMIPHNYIPPNHYSEFQPHNFLPLPSFHKQPSSLTATYGDFSPLPPQQAISIIRDYRETENGSDHNLCYQVCDSGLEAQTRDHVSRTSVDTTTSRDDPNLSKWAMVDPRLLTSSQLELGNDDAAHEQDDVNASSMTRILSIRGEIDLWGYRK